MDARYVIVALILAVAAVVYFMASGEALPLLLGIGILFSAHFAHDEIMLHGEQRSPANLIAVAGFSLYFAVLVGTYAFPQLASYAPYAPLIPLAAFALRLCVHRGSPSRTEWYLWFVEAIVGVVMMVTGNPSSALAAIVLLHVANWYVGYDSRLVGNKVRRVRYWTEVMVWLLVIGLLFAVYAYTHSHILELLFRVRYYYAWAIAHIVLSYIASLPRVGSRVGVVT